MRGRNQSSEKTAGSKAGFGFTLIILILFLIPRFLFGQMTVRGMGMGGAYTALARGVHAQVYNPANLGLPDNSKFSMTIFSVEAGAWNNSFTKGMYDQYLTDENDTEWDENDIEDILNHIPAGGFELNANTSVRMFSFSAGPFAFSLGADAGTFIQLDKATFEFPLSGNELGQTYRFNNMNGQALGVGKASLSLGLPFQMPYVDAFAAGATVHLMYSGVYGTIDNADLSFTTAGYGFDINGEYGLTYAIPADDDGNVQTKVGVALDLGVAAQMKQKWTVSLGVSNVLGTLPWLYGQEFEGFVRTDSLSILDFEDMDDVFEDSSWTMDKAAFTTRLPMILRLGCAYEEGNVLLTADYCQGFSEGAWIGTKPQFAFGTEWRGLSWLPLRMGVVVGGRIGFGTSFGFGFRPGGFVLDVGIMNRGFLTASNSKGLIVGVELGIDIRGKKSDVVRVGDF
jgi:hypothetical protein